MPKSVVSVFARVDATFGDEADGIAAKGGMRYFALHMSASGLTGHGDWSLSGQLVTPLGHCRGCRSSDPSSSIPDDLAGHARKAERAFQGGAVPLPGRSRCLIGAHQKVHERLLRVMGGAHRVVR